MARRKTVLVVDDSRAVADALGAAFEGAGYEVLSAEGGEEVFRRLSAAPPDAILLDVFTPELNGVDVCRVVKAHPHWKQTFLVLMSSRMSDGELDMYRRLGADEILKKPLDPDHAVAIVEEALAPVAAP